MDELASARYGGEVAPDVYWRIYLASQVRFDRTLSHIRRAFNRLECLRTLPYCNSYDG